VEGDVPEDNGITSVERGLRLMEALLDGPEGATALAAKLGISKATAFRLARTLQGLGYVVQGADSRYALGPRCLILAAWAYAHIDIRRELRWAEEELNSRTGETALLTVQAGRDSVCIDSIPSTQSVVSVASVGAVWPAHTCSSGLAFLADDKDFREEYLQQPLTQATAHTIQDAEALRGLLEEFHDKGYAVNSAYWRDGVFAVGAVVHDASTKPIAALSVMMPEFRLEQNGVETLGALVADVAARASARLGYRGSPSDMA